MLGVALLAGLLFWRRPLAWLLVVFSFAMHFVEDYLTVAWNLYPWQPFAASAVSLAHYLPSWLVQGVFQAVAMIFILGMTVWIYLRHRRTPLEILSPALDRLVVNYAVLPWRTRCARCGHRAHFRCDRCGQAACGAHANLGAGLAVRCLGCAG